MKKIIAIIGFPILLRLCSYGQIYVNENPSMGNGQSPNFKSPSSNASNLGMYGQIPIGNYTGSANIGVPLYKIKYKEIELPIGINYHAAGIKPDLFPGSVGLGWTLQAGGTVTRIINGVPDYEDFNGTLIVPLINNPTQQSDWSGPSKMAQYLEGYYCPDDMSNPDEYYFQFNDKSGKFYLDQNGVYQVKSSSGEYFSITADIVTNKKFKVPNLSQDPTLPFILTYKDTIYKSKVINKITITDGQGVKYIFGGTDNSVEFSRPGDGTYAGLDAATIHWNITPVSWQLTSIESPNGYKITLEYEPKTFVTKTGFSIVQSAGWYPVGQPYVGGGGLQSAAWAEKSNLINGCFLKKITSPTEVITFGNTEAKQQLLFPADSLLHNPASRNQNEFRNYMDVANAYTEKLLPLKLDTIEIRDNAQKLLRKVLFNYTTSKTTRLKLLDVRIQGSNYIMPEVYSFNYDTLSLPPYLSLKTDHYGYYNGRNDYINSNNPANYLTIDSVAFFNSKNSDPAFLQAEMLKKVTYPTGGYTEFEYEPHDYSAYTTKWPFGLTTNAGNVNKTVGGLRIKKVASFDGNGGKTMEKRYIYSKNYKTNGTSSSGILSYTPVYKKYYTGTVVAPARQQWSSYNGTFVFRQWSCLPLYAMSAGNGSHITYSEVTEVNDNGGFTVNKFKNYDNGYNDLTPLAYVSDNTAIREFWKDDDGISMNLERGQITSQELYDSLKVLKAKTAYKYNDDPNRFLKNIRVISQTANEGPGYTTIPSFRVVAKLIYTYFPYLKEKSDIEYGINNDSVVTTTQYTYDTTYRLLKKAVVSTSDGHTMASIKRYPRDMVDSGFTTPYTTMVTRNMVNFVIEQEDQYDNVRQMLHRTEFSTNLSANTTLALPARTLTRYKNLPLQPREIFNTYDSTGNVLSENAAWGPKTCYVYSYNYLHPIATIQNAEYSTVASVLGGQAAIDAFAKKTPTNEEVFAFLAPLRSSPLLSTAMVSSYTYDPLVGVTTAVDVNGKKMYYEYDNFGRLSALRDNDSMITKTYCYNFSGQIEDCSKGRADYAFVELQKATTAADVCNTGGITQYMQGYSARSEPLTTTPSPTFSDRKDYYSDKNLSNPLPTGFYKSYNATNGPIPNGTYYYIQDGKYVYKNSCGFVEPQMLKYSDTLLPTMCDLNLPLVPVFGTIAQGNTLYHDFGLSPKIKDGYYVYNGNYFKATNGVAGPMAACSTIGTVSTTMLNKVAFYPTRCAGARTISGYYTQPLQLGIVVYSNASLSATLPAGYYISIDKKFQLNGSGAIILIDDCF